MSPIGAIVVALAFAVLALAEPEAAGGLGGQPSFGGGTAGNGGGFGGQQRRLPYGADINTGRNSFGRQRFERSPEAGQFGGRGGFGGNGGGYGGNGGGFGRGRGGFGGNSEGSSYARPQQQQRGLPYGANTPFGNQQSNGFGGGRQNGGFGGGRQNGGFGSGRQNGGFGGGQGQVGYI